MLFGVEFFYFSFFLFLHPSTTILLLMFVVPHRNSTLGTLVSCRACVLPSHRDIVPPSHRDVVPPLLAALRQCDLPLPFRCTVNPPPPLLYAVVSSATPSKFVSSSPFPFRRCRSLPFPFQICHFSLCSSSFLGLVGGLDGGWWMVVAISR